MSAATQEPEGVKDVGSSLHGPGFLRRIFRRGAAVVPAEEAKFIGHGLDDLLAGVQAFAEAPFDSTLSTMEQPDFLATDHMTAPDPLPGVVGKVDYLLSSPDGNRLAAANGKEVCVWALRQGAPMVGECAHLQTGQSRALCFSPSGKYLASVPLNGSVVSIWYEQTPPDTHKDFATMQWRLLHELSVDATALMCAFLGNELRMLIAASGPPGGRTKDVVDKKQLADGHTELQLWHTERCEKLATAGCCGESAIKVMALSPNHRWVALARTRSEGMREQGRIQILTMDSEVDWEDEHGPNKMEELRHGGEVATALAWNPSSSRLASAHASYIAVWRGPAAYADSHGATSDELLGGVIDGWSPPWIQERRLEDPDGRFKLRGSVLFTPDGHSVVAGGQIGPGGAVALWDLESGGLARTWRNAGKIQGIACPAGSASIAFAAEGSREVQWLSRGWSSREMILEPYAMGTLEADVTSDAYGSLSFTGGAARDKSSELQSRQPCQGALALDGNLFAATGATSTAWHISVFNLHPGGAGSSQQRVLKLPRHRNCPQAIAIHTPTTKAAPSEDHQQSGTSGRDSGLAEFLKKKAAAQPSREQGHAMVAVAVSHRLVVWDAETSTQLPGGLDVTLGATCVAFAPDGSFVAVGCQGKRSRCKVAIVLISDLKSGASDHDATCTSAVLSCPECTPRGSTDKEFQINSIAVASAVSAEDFYIVAANEYSMGIYVFNHEDHQLRMCKDVSVERVRSTAISAYMGAGERKAFHFAAVTADLTLQVWTYGASLKQRTRLHGDLPPSQARFSEVAAHGSDNARPYVPSMLSSAGQRVGALATAAPSVLMRFCTSHSKASLAISAGPRLTVWTSYSPPGSGRGQETWTMCYDLHFTGTVLDFCFDAAATEDMRPRSVVVQCSNMGSGAAAGARASTDGAREADDGPAFYRVCDLHEYSLAFHLYDNGFEQLLERFGAEAFLAHLKALPGLLHQRCSFRHRESHEKSLSTIFHWAATGRESLMNALLQHVRSTKTGASPFHIDSLGYNAVDYALRREDFAIVDEILTAAISCTSLLAHLLPESHLSLTRTVVHLLHHTIPSMAEFLDCACLRAPEELAPDVQSIPVHAVDVHQASLRTSAGVVPMLTRSVCDAIAPSGEQHSIRQPVDVRMLILRGALDLDRRFIRAFCRTRNTDVLASLTAKVVIRHKWAAYGRRIFLKQFMTHLLFLAIFCLWSYLHVQKVRPFRPFSGIFSDSEIDSDRSGVLIMQLCGLLLTLLSVYFSYAEVLQVLRPAYELQIKDDTDERRNVVEWVFLLRKGCFDYVGIWNLLDLVRLACVTNIVWFEHTWTNQVVSFTAFIMWVQVLRFVRGFHDTGALVELVVQVLKDTGAFLIVVMIQLAAFTHGFYVMLGSDPFIEISVDEGETSWEKVIPVLESFLFTYRLFLGETDIDVHDRSWPVKLMWLVCTFITCVVMLNLLISVIGDTYNKVQDEEIIARNRQLAKLVYEADTLRRILPSSDPPSGCYLFAALRKERPLTGYRTTDAGMDPSELRKSDRAIDKELRRQSHCRLVRLEESAQTVQSLDSKLQVVSNRLTTVEHILQHQTLQVRSVVRSELDALRRDLALPSAANAGGMSALTTPRPHGGGSEATDLH